MFEPLPEDIAAALGAAASTLGPYGALRYVSETGSTNDAALALAAAGAAEGTSVLADLQRQGRGRRGNEWFSPAESGIYLSLVVRPNVAPAALPMVTIAAGVAVAEAVTVVSGLPAELKWPNDLVIGRPWRKMGGVLAETASTGARVDAVVVGIGINVRPSSFPASLSRRATSIETELGRSVDRARLVVQLLISMRAMMGLVHEGRRGDIAARWREFAGAGLRGADVRFSGVNGRSRGSAMDIDDEGALLVSVQGRVERVIAGEVAWEMLSGE
jgi:BirA family biotin operon repressor/biotin-[acetyl-CoA-carboxylase] ligase